MKILVLALVACGVLASAYLAHRYVVITAGANHIIVTGSEGCTSRVDVARGKFIVTCKPVVIVNNIRTYSR